MQTPATHPQYYRQLGKSGLQVSTIGLGSMTWGTQNTETQAHAQIELALREGVNFWDTAEMYPTNPVQQSTMGNTESIIGNWFAQHGQREKVILATKITGPGKYKLRAESNITPTTLREALTASLKRLQTDYIDLYQLHWPNRGSYHFGQHWSYTGPHSTILSQRPEKVLDDLRAILQTLCDFIKEGKIRHWGVSNDSSWGVMTMLRLCDEMGVPRPVSIQNEFNLTCRLFEPDLAEVALRENIGLLAWSPLAGGMLSGKYFGGATPEGSRVSLAGYSGKHRNTPMAQAAYDAYTTVARNHGLDPAQMAVVFTLAMPFCTSSIVGATTLEQLKTNIAARDVKLSANVLDDIEKVRRQYPMPY